MVTILCEGLFLHGKWHINKNACEQIIRQKLRPNFHVGSIKRTVYREFLSIFWGLRLPVWVCVRVMHDVRVCNSLPTRKMYANDLRPSYNSFFLIGLSLAYALPFSPSISTQSVEFIQKMHVFGQTNLWPSQIIIIFLRLISSFVCFSHTLLMRYNCVRTYVVLIAQVLFWFALCLLTQTFTFSFNASFSALILGTIEENLWRSNWFLIHA